MLEPVGWALIHSVWQAAALAVLLALALAATRRSRPTVRYALTLAALLATVLLPLATAVWFDPAPPGDRVARRGDRTGDEVGAEFASAALDPDAIVPAAGWGRGGDGREPARFAPLGARIRSEVEAALPVIVMLWASGLLLSLARLGGDILALRRLVREDAAPPAKPLPDLVQRLVVRLRIRGTVTIRHSARVQVPLVVGWMRPLILVPAALVSGLTPAELEALVAHELAHIRRHDVLVNQLQRAIETIFFFHPAVWWISAQVREEREHCCDDLAVRACDGDAAAYASALLSLEVRRDPGFAIGLAATGGSLLRRVQRLVDGRSGRVELGVSWMVGTLGLLAFFVSTESAMLHRDSRGGTMANSAGASAHSGASAVDSAVAEPPGSDGEAGASRRMTTLWRVVGTGSLHARWHRAVHAGGRDAREWWVGYAIAGPADSRVRVHFDDSVAIQLGRDRERGRVLWRAGTREVHVPGERLPRLPGLEDSAAVVVLAGFRRSPDGAPRLARLHVASAGLPAALGVRPVYWLGIARDAESIALLRELFATAPKGLQRDFVATIGVHGDATPVLSVLGAWLADERQRDGVREEAAHWLAQHPTHAALVTLAEAARTIQDRDVMTETIEALGELQVEAATDTLVALARVSGARARREAAIEALGDRGARAVPHLLALATEPGDAKLQEEAVSALARAAADSTLHLVAQVALSHARAPVRERAARAYARAASPARAIAALHAILETDPDRKVRLDAVRSMRRVRSVPLAVESLSALARGHENGGIRAAAVRTLGDLRRHPPARSALRELAESGREDVRERAREVLERL